MSLCDLTDQKNLVIRPSEIFGTYSTFRLMERILMPIHFTANTEAKMCLCLLKKSMLFLKLNDSTLLVERLEEKDRFETGTKVI